MRKNRLYKKGEPFRDARLFIVACEGEKREKDYFERLGKGSRRIKVRVLAPDPSDSLSAPKWVLDRLVRYVEKEGINILEGDQVWLVMDVDRWKAEQLHDIDQYCKEHKWGFALSNPCFEVWLLLHIKALQDSTSNSCKDFKRELDAALKGGYNLTTFITYATDAIARSQAHETDPNSPIPAHKTSRVHLAVQALLEYV